MILNPRLTRLRREVCARRHYSLPPPSPTSIITSATRWADTTVRASQLSDAEVDAAAGDLVYVYYEHGPTPQTQHQDFKQQGVERLTSHMCEIARGHVEKEPSQPDSQTTSQPLHTTHIGLSAKSECNCQLATFQPTALIAA
ncbi:unnamed protein product [Schistocephalus solidus]|uniref:Uncharacterized protein n=1 Tax=Schistocephalus solidus TaxID=70667 RepID=A0A183T2Z2_SCHSO|nr:unnamed protein product [Schistocephalus solidus]